jgi:hypothetical protein
MSTDIPRRIRLDLLTPEELALVNMVEQIEKLGAHPLLTDVVVLLGKARSKLADWVELEICSKCGANVKGLVYCKVCGKDVPRRTECMCGYDETTGLRMDIVCPVHDRMQWLEL